MTTIVSVFYYLVVLVWSLSYFVFMLVLFLLTFLFDRERKALHAASRLWAKSIIWLNPLWKLRVTGRENIVKGETYVITVNHQSMLDIPLMYVLPGINFKWVAKKEIYRWPIFGVVMLLHGDITVEHGSSRKARQFIIKSLERLKHGTSVIIFPEGTRSKSGEIHNFKDGAFSLAKRAEVPLLPTVINGAKSFIKGWRVQRTVFEVSILPAIAVETVAEIPTRELMGRVRELTVTELARLREHNPA